MAGTIESGSDLNTGGQNWLKTLGKDIQEGLGAIAQKLGIDGLVSDLDRLLATPSVLDSFVPPQERAKAPVAPESYTVKKGDTLSAIAMRTGHSVEELARINGLSNPDRLSIGQVLTLGGDAAPAARTQARPATAQAVTSPGNAPSVSGLSQNGMDFIYDHEAQTGVSNRLHWPKAGSGVTLGPGYDMKGRTADAIERDLTAIGIDPQAARKAGEGAGLTGSAARDFAVANKDLISLNGAQEKALLRQTVEPYAAKVRDAIKVPVTQNQFDAMVSLAYNIGTGKDGFAGSTALARLNAGDAKGAAEAMRSNCSIPPALRWQRLPLPRRTSRRRRP